MDASARPPDDLPGEFGSGEPSLPPPPSPMPPFPPDLPPPDEAPLISSTSIFFGLLLVLAIGVYAFGVLQRRRRAWQSRADAEALLYSTEGGGAGARAAVQADRDEEDARAYAPHQEM